MVKNLKLRTFNKILQMFALLLIVFLICGPPPKTNNTYADSNVGQISSQDQTIHRGQAFDVDINLADNPGILTLYITVKFDHSVFTLTNVQQVRNALGDLNLEHSGSGYDYIDSETGGFNLFWDGGTQDTSNGTIARLTFESSLTAPTGTYPIELVVVGKHTTSALNVYANVQATSPQITLIEGKYIVVWHNWDGVAIENPKVADDHPRNPLTGGYEYNSEDSLNVATDFPDIPIRIADDMYTYQFAGWLGAVWRGDVPNDSSVIYYIAKFTSIPKEYEVEYYVDGLGEGNVPNGIIEEIELSSAKNTAYGSVIDDTELPTKPDYTFYGWYIDSEFTQRLYASYRMPAHDIKLYGYFKYNIREIDVPTIHLIYTKTETNTNLEQIAYVDVLLEQNNGGLNSLMITLSSYDKDNFTFCGFSNKGDDVIFKEMSFITTGYDKENNIFPDNFSFSWNRSSENTNIDSSMNSYATGRLLTLMFKVNANASPGAYEVVMTANKQNTTYKNYKDNVTWYSDIEFINTKLPIGETNHWFKDIPGTTTTIEVNSSASVPYNVEFIAIVINKEIETVIDNDSLNEVLGDNLMVHTMYELYFQQNATRLTPEEFIELFGNGNLVVKIKLTDFQRSCKNLNIYYIDNNGKLNLYNTQIEDGYLVFETNHFSNWALIGDILLASAETSSVRLLRITLLLFGISTSALISIAFVRNRKKQSLIVYQNKIKGGNEN